MAEWWEEYETADGKPKNNKNEAYWRNRLKGQGEIKAAPPRSAWRRFFDNLENTMRNYGPANIVARNVAPLVETGDGSTREERRARINQKVRQRRENFAAVDPADSVGDYAADFAGSLAGSALSDPTNFIGGFGKNLGERVVNMMGTNAAIDVGLQGADVAQGVQDEYDPVQGAVSVAVPPAIVGGGRLAQKGYQKIKPVVGKVTSGFGKRRAPKAGASTDHGGIDIAVPEGTVVQAPGRGVVSKVGRGHSKRGNWVEIDHGNGLVSRYLHLAGFRVKPGDRVEPGQLFGRSGKTGNVTGPHLHWSVLKDGKPVDPESVDFNLADVPSRPAHPMSPEGIRTAVRDEEAGVLTPEAQRIIDEANDEGIELSPYEARSGITKDDIDEDWIAAGRPDNVVNMDDVILRRAAEALQKQGKTIEDVLTPAERQEMDASVTGRPPAENTGYEKFTPYVEPKTAANDPTKPSLGTTVKNVVKDIIDDESGSLNPFSRRGYRDDPEGPDQPSPTAPRDEVEQRLLDELRDAPSLNREQRNLYHEERSRRASSLANLQREPGSMDNYIRQLSSLRGALPKVDFESIADRFSSEDVNHLLNRINRSNYLLPHDKVAAQTALLNLLAEDAGKLPTPSEIRKLSEVFSPDLIETLINRLPLKEKVKQALISTMNIPRALMASADISAPFRQGILLAGRKEFWKNLGPMFKVLFSENNSKALLKEIKDRPTYSAMQEARLAITDPHKHFLLDREEDFMSDYAEKIPGWGRVVKASNRAYSGFLNRLRADYFDRLVREYREAGIDITQDKARLRGLGRYINLATGRGDLPGSLNKAAPLLNNIFFSPRLIASRVQTFTTLANPVSYVNADPILRKQAWGNALRLGAIALSVAGLTKMMGMDVETDPRHPDFMKPKTGNTRYDILGGYQQYIRLGAQILTNEKITQKGETVELDGDGKFDDDIVDVIGRFFRSKENPIVSFGHNYLRGENVIGEKFDRTTDVGGVDVPSEVLERFIPMATQDIIDAYKEYGGKGVLMATPALTGVGVQTYEPTSTKKASKKNDNWWEEFEPSDSFSQSSKRNEWGSEW